MRQYFLFYPLLLLGPKLHLGFLHTWTPQSQPQSSLSVSGITRPRHALQTGTSSSWPSTNGRATPSPLFLSALRRLSVLVRFCQLPGMVATGWGKWVKDFWTLLRCLFCLSQGSTCPTHWFSHSLPSHQSRFLSVFLFWFFLFSPSGPFFQLLLFFLLFFCLLCKGIHAATGKTVPQAQEVNLHCSSESWKTERETTLVADLSTAPELAGTVFTSQSVLKALSQTDLKKAITMSKIISLSH